MKVILNRIYKVFNIRFTKFHYIFFIFFCIISIIFISINTSFIQTKISNFFLKKINKELNIKLTLNELDIHFISGIIKIKKIKLLDYKNNTAIFIPFLKLKINLFDIIFSKKQIKVKEFLLYKPILNIFIYKGDKNSNIYNIINSIISKYRNKNTNFFKGFFFSNIEIKNTNLQISNFNKKNFNKLLFVSHNINLIIKNLLFFNSNIELDRLYLMFNGILNKKNINIYNSYKNVYISLNKIKIFNTKLFLNKSKIYASVFLFYKKYSDLLKFFNKIKFYIEIKKKSYLSQNDIKYFYNLKLKKHIFLNGKLYGIFNKYIVLKDFYLKNNNNVIISKKIILYNILDKKKFKIIQNKYTYLCFYYNNIKNIIPKYILLKYPFFLKNFGKIKYLGELIINNNNIISNGYIDICNKASFNGKFFFNKKNNTYEGNGIIKILNPYFFLKIKKIDYIKFNIFFRGNNFLKKNIKLKFNILSGILIFYNKKISNINISSHFFNNIFYSNIYIKNSILKIKCLIKTNWFITKDIFFINSFIRIKFLIFNFLKSNINIRSIYDTNMYFNFKFFDKQNLNINFFLDKINILNYKKEKIYFESINIFYKISKVIKKTFIICIHDLLDISLTGNFNWLYIINIIEYNIKSILYNQTYIPNNHSNEYLDFKIIFKKNFNKKLLNILNINLIGQIKNNNINIISKNIKYKNFYLNNLYFNIKNSKDIKLIIDDIYCNNNIKIKNFSFFIKKEKKHNIINIKYLAYIYNIYQYCNIHFYKKVIILNRKKFLILKINNFLLKINDNNWILNKNKKNTILIDLLNKKIFLSKIYYLYNNKSYNITYRLLKNRYHLLELIINNFLLKNINYNKFICKVFFIKNRKYLGTEIDIKIKNLLFNNEKINYINLNIFFNKKNNIYICSIKINNINIIDISTSINNYFFNEKFILDMKINIKNCPITIFNDLTKQINIRGNLSGEFNINIKNNNINYSGLFLLNNVSIKINYLNTEYEFMDESFIMIKQNRIIFNNLKIRDIKYNTIAIANGIIIIENNKCILSLSIDSKNILILDTKIIHENSLYGKIFSEGKVHILYDNDNININISDSKILKDSKIFITTTNINNEIKEVSFIKNIKNIKILNFIDKLKKNIQEYHKVFNISIKYYITDLCDIILIPDINDKNTFIKVKGFGDFLLKLNSYDDIEMIGKYYINDGYYNFYYNKIPIVKINKKLKIKKGGIIIWNGIYNNPILNITALYNANYISQYIEQNNIHDMNLLLLNNNIINIIISGTLNNPTFEFKINIPFFKKLYNI